MPPAERWPHGVRARYVCGCRCDPCRAANTAYARVLAERVRLAAEENADKRERHTPATVCPGTTARGRICGARTRMDSPGGICERCRRRLVDDCIVSAAPARAHMVVLSNAGVGRRVVADASGVSLSVVEAIRRGARRRARRSTVAAILSVTAEALADHSLVDAAPSWILLDELIALGFTKRAIAKSIHGPRSVALQVRGDSVLARTALRIRRVHTATMTALEQAKRREGARCNCKVPMPLARRESVYCAKCDGLLRGDP